MDARLPPRLTIAPVVVGVAIGALLVVLSFEPQPGPPGFSNTVTPSGESWNLTPPSTWCTTTPLSGGGVEYSCSMAGAGSIALNVTKPSRLLGSIEVDGPFSVWLVPAAWTCELQVQLSGFVHSCPIPFDPPPWGTWTSGQSGAGSMNLSRLPINVTQSTGVIPPAYWMLFIVDGVDVNETATVTSAVVLVSP